MINIIILNIKRFFAGFVLIGGSMKTRNSFLIILFLIGSLSAYAFNLNPRLDEITQFYSEHYHLQAETIGAPSHSGGTDRFGCHNASVPYHCH